MPCQPFSRNSSEPPLIMFTNLGRRKKSPSRTNTTLQKKDCIAWIDGSRSRVTRSRILVLACTQPKQYFLSSRDRTPYKSKMFALICSFSQLMSRGSFANSLALIKVFKSRCKTISTPVPQRARDAKSLTISSKAWPLAFFQLWSALITLLIVSRSDIPDLRNK